MNFFGHAVVAGQSGGDDHFVLGAMLPDLLRMIGRRRAPVLHDRVAAGVAHHHAVDAVFHEHPGFVAAERACRRALQDAGLERGAAWGAAHVGVELVLDGELAQRFDADGFVAALVLARSDGERLVETAGALTVLASRLEEAGLPAAYRDLDEVGRRLVRILARSPRLAPGDAAAPVITGVLGAMRSELATLAARVIDDVLARIPTG